MNFPTSIFCLCPTCNSGCRLPRKQSQLCNVMVEPVNLSCSHKFCSSCLHIASNKCGVCGISSTPTVDPLLKEFCDWFRAHESVLIPLCEGSTNASAFKRPALIKPPNGIITKPLPTTTDAPVAKPLPSPAKAKTPREYANSPSPPPSSSSPSTSPPSMSPLSGVPPRKLASSLPARPPITSPEQSPTTSPAVSPRPISFAKKLATRRESSPGDMEGVQKVTSQPQLNMKEASLARSSSSPAESNSLLESIAEQPLPSEPKGPAPTPPPKPKVKYHTLRGPPTGFNLANSTESSPPSPVKYNTLRGLPTGFNLSTGDPTSPSSAPSSPVLSSAPPTPPMKPQKLNRLTERPVSSPDLTKLTPRAPKAEDFKHLFASLGSGDFDGFGKSYDWASKPVDRASLIWTDNQKEQLFARIEGWVNETGKGYSKIHIEDKDKDVLWYATHLHGKDHAIYIGGEDDNVQVFAVETCEHGDHPQPFKVLTITKEGTERIWIQESSSLKQRMKAIKQVWSHAPNASAMVHVKGPEIGQELLKWESRSIFKAYKFGALYCKQGQSTEEEIFGNEHGSPEFESFLSVIGDKIQLKGWTQYSGGLNVDAGLEGSHSVYTQYEGFEIMFHVSTLLPFNPGDLQQLARKSCCIYGWTLPPTETKLYQNAIYSYPVLIRDGQKTKYRLSVAAKNDVRPFGPFLPETMEFESGPLFREYLLTKLINAERAALGATSFKERMGKARHLFINNLHDVYGK